MTQEIQNLEELKIFNDRRGSLAPIEFSSLPFVPKRIFYVYDVPLHMERGGHAHKQTEQVLICLKGEISATLKYWSFSENKICETKLNLKEGQRVHVGRVVWDSQRFMSPDAVLLVLCNTEFDESDYIRDWEEFVKIKEQAK